MNRHSVKERHKRTKIAKIVDSCKPLFLWKIYLQAIQKAV